MMSDLEQIEVLTRCFEKRLIDANQMSIEEVSPLIKLLGGDIEAVRGCNHSGSLTAYISTLTIRYLLTSR